MKTDKNNINENCSDDLFLSKNCKYFIELASIYSNRVSYKKLYSDQSIQKYLKENNKKVGVL